MISLALNDVGKISIVFLCTMLFLVLFMFFAYFATYISKKIHHKSNENENELNGKIYQMIYEHPKEISISRLIDELGLPEEVIQKRINDLLQKEVIEAIHINNQIYYQIKTNKGIE